MNIQINLGSINWDKLRTQKLFLINSRDEDADGLIALIDHIQDEAVRTEQATESEVFILEDES